MRRNLPQPQHQVGFVGGILVFLLLTLPHGLHGTDPSLSSVSPRPARYRLTPLTPVPGRESGPAAGFRPVPPDRSGVRFTNTLAEASAAHNRILENGSGLALGDVDGDGLCDLYLCRLEGPNVLYRNLGNWRFEDVTEAAGVGCPNQNSTGAVLADVDGDGDLDLLVNGIGAGTRLFLNDGSGRFTESTEGRLARRFGATSMALADLNNDGWLDLYVTNYRTDTYKDHPPGLRVEAVRQNDGRIVIRPEGRFIPLQPREGALEVLELGERDILYLNQGGGRFAPVSWTGGGFVDVQGQPLTSAPMEWGLAVVFRDLNGDGTPDLYVCNDFAGSRDRLWFNEDSLRLRAAPPFTLRNQSLASMAADVADLDRDGHMDLFVADMLGRSLEARAWQRPNTLAGLIHAPKLDPLFEPEVTRNTLHRARGDGTFAEIACFAGLAATDWTWNVAFVDIDLDGWEDLLIADGNAHDVQHADVLAELSRVREPRTAARRLEQLRRFPRLAVPNLAFRNQRDLTFADVSTAWGFHDIGVTTGLALADLDNDGDLDVVTSDLNGPVRLHENLSTQPRIAVRLQGRPPNTQGIGARIRVLGGPVPQEQEMVSGGRYASGDEAQRVFAAGAADAVLSVEVTWRSGSRSVVHPVPAQHRVEIWEPDPETPVPAPNPRAAPSPLFHALSPPLPQARHEDTPFDDFLHQPLLPAAISRFGPALTWADIDGDGLPDLLLPGGHGGRLKAWLNGTGAVFRPHRPAEWPEINPVPQQTVLPWPQTGTPGHSWIVGTSVLREMDPPRVQPASPGFVLHAGPGQPAGPAITPLPPVHGTAWPLAVGTLDASGTRCLFVGGRTPPGQWPQSSSSSMWRQDADGTFSTLPFPEDVGRVTGAVFTDLNQDGWPDLAVSTEWGPIRIFLHEQGSWTERTREMGLSDATGWWTCVTSADVDGDGWPDLIAGNWGRNFRTDPARGEPERPVRLYWSRRPEGGNVPLLASQDPWGPETGASRWVPWRDRPSVVSVLPGVETLHPSHVAYGQADAAGLLATTGAPVHHLEATVFASSVFLNRSGRFERVSLPSHAQFAPVLGIAVADLNLDGHADLVLGQNFFGTDPETARQDAGMGLVLLGQGDGRFTALSPQASGLRLPGEGRGVAVADFDRDGRPDIAMVQRDGDVRLFRNATQREGLTVTFHSHPPGTSLRLHWTDPSLPPSPRMELKWGEADGSVSYPEVFLASQGIPAWLEIREVGQPARRLSWPGKARSVILDGPALRSATPQTREPSKSL